MLEIVRILMDYEKDPAGVEEMPQFNWELKSDKRGVVQKAYQLQKVLQKLKLPTYNDYISCFRPSYIYATKSHFLIRLSEFRRPSE